MYAYGLEQIKEAARENDNRTCRRWYLRKLIFRMQKNYYGRFFDKWKFDAFDKVTSKLTGQSDAYQE